MLLRPPKFLFREDTAESCCPPVDSQLFEHLVGTMTKAADPWRALEEMREKLLIERPPRPTRRPKSKLASNE